MKDGESPYIKGEKSEMLIKPDCGIVPVFYAADENYLPFLAVALASLKAHASKQRSYHIHVLCSGGLGDNAKKIKQMAMENIHVSFHDVSKSIEEIVNVLHCRDYYTPAIFYRLFIPELFPQYDKAIYLDCDTVLCADIGNLYDIDIKDNFIGAVAEKYIFTFIAKVSGYNVAQILTLGVGVKLKLLYLGFGYRFDNLGRRWKRGFVRVELYVFHITGLFTRNVRFERCVS